MNKSNDSTIILKLAEKAAEHELEIMELKKDIDQLRGEVKICASMLDDMRGINDFRSFTEMVDSWKK